MNVLRRACLDLNVGQTAEDDMKGIILAGGSGTRLYPSTIAISKQLLPVYDKPLVYYALAVLMLAKIRDILMITTPHDQPLFQQLLHDGRQFGVRISYAIQPRPEGLAQAFIIGRDFIGDDNSALVLGDNIFYGHGFADLLMKVRTAGATVFAYEVADPERYGVISFNTDGKAIAIDEKPKNPRSNWAVTGLYFYDNEVLRYAQEIKPSHRGELEITDINRRYLESGRLHVERMGRGYAWLDTGTASSLLDASEYVATIERRQGLKISCPEEIALRLGFVTFAELQPHLNRLGNSDYATYVRKIAQTLEATHAS
jgi:glucose-1-phosphate thymidylyltransferase